MLNKVKSLNLQDEVTNIISKDKRVLILLNQSQLFDFGVDSQDKKLREYQSRSYAAKKNARNPQPGFGTPDLFDTRSFYGDFFIEVKKDVIVFDSKDSKSADLEKKYGNDIFGLTKGNKQVYLGQFYEKLQDYITEKTGLVFK